MSRRWIFVVNNYTDADQDKFRELECTYLVYGREVGEEGTPHLQGYVVFKSNKRLSACKKIHATAHWEIARGSNSQNHEYCTKGGDCHITGDLPDDGAGASEASRWTAAREAATAGRLEDIPDDIYVRYYRTMKEIKKDHMQRPGDLDACSGEWYYGPPGVGKSHLAREKYPNAYLKMQNKWWDGYQEEESVIMDDFDCKELGHLMKIWSDKYSFLAETKGGAIHIRPKRIIVTSNYKPEDLWEGVLLEAIKRRFKITHVLPWTAVRSGTTP